MAKKSDRIVGPHPKGGWQAKAPGAKRASVRTDMQKAAMDKTRNIVENQGGGEMTVQGKDGRIRQKNTIKPGNDPRNIEG